MSNQIDKALRSAIKALETSWTICCDEDYLDGFIDAANQCKSALAEIGKCEPVAFLAIKNTELKNRVEVLEDLLTSAAIIACRNGEGTHWERFINQLKANGIGNITAKTFRVLPSDEGYTSPQQREWVGLIEDDMKQCWNSLTDTQFYFDYARAIESKLKQLNMKG